MWRNRRRPPRRIYKPAGTTPRQRQGSLPIRRPLCWPRGTKRRKLPPTLSGWRCRLPRNNQLPSKPGSARMFSPGSSGYRRMSSRPVLWSLPRSRQLLKRSRTQGRRAPQTSPTWHSGKKLPRTSCSRAGKTWPRRHRNLPTQRSFCSPRGTKRNGFQRTLPLWRSSSPRNGQMPPKLTGARGFSPRSCRPARTRLRRSLPK
ncbi:hypothetical protein DFJ74DRAFT_653577 [Hyaloraphidium curvatum]|nr:hypothetical protein DFJ74DRAFT_653577 [Hyaloraphidium curvatum]